MKKTFYIYAVLAIQFVIFSQIKIPDQLPFQTPQSKIKHLRNLTDDKLQTELLKKLSESPEIKKLIRNKKFAMGLVDLKNPDNIRYASVNGEEMMYAASLPKIAVLLAAMDAIEKKEINESEETIADLNDMIRVSSNPAATRMIDLVGFKRIKNVLTDKNYKLYDEELGGGLWVGKRYAKTGRRIGDPMHNISHGATAEQVCRFYYLLAFGKLVSFNRSKQMLNILVNPGIHHKFVKIIEKIAPSAKLYRKSGTWKVWHSDSMIVWGADWRKYILVGLVENENGSKIIEKLVTIAEELLRPK